MLGTYIYDALRDGLIDSIKDELVIDVLLVSQGRSCPSQLQVVIQLCIVTILSQKSKDYTFRRQVHEKPSIIPGRPGSPKVSPGTPGKHTEKENTQKRQTHRK